MTKTPKRDDKHPYLFYIQVPPGIKTPVLSTFLPIQAPIPDKSQTFGSQEHYKQHLWYVAIEPAQPALFGLPTSQAIFDMERRTVEDWD